MAALVRRGGVVACCGGVLLDAPCAGSPPGPGGAQWSPDPDAAFGRRRPVSPAVLNSSDVSYALNAALAEGNDYRQALSALIAAVQDSFAAADVEILSPLYQAHRDGNPRVIPRPTVH